MQGNHQVSSYPQWTSTSDSVRDSDSFCYLISLILFYHLLVIPPYIHQFYPSQMDFTSFHFNHDFEWFKFLPWCMWQMLIHDDADFCFFTWCSFCRKKSHYSSVARNLTRKTCLGSQIHSCSSTEQMNAASEWNAFVYVGRGGEKICFHVLIQLLNVLDVLLAAQLCVTRQKSSRTLWIPLGSLSLSLSEHCAMETMTGQLRFEICCLVMQDGFC